MYIVYKFTCVCFTGTPETMSMKIGTYTYDLSYKQNSVGIKCPQCLYTKDGKEVTYIISVYQNVDNR